jgi:hypothetical protein
VNLTVAGDEIGSFTGVVGGDTRPDSELLSSVDAVRFSAGAISCEAVVNAGWRAVGIVGIVTLLEVLVLPMLVPVLLPLMLPVLVLLELLVLLLLLLPVLVPLVVLLLTAVCERGSFAAGFGFGFAGGAIIFLRGTVLRTPLRWLSRSSSARACFCARAEVQGRQHQHSAGDALPRYDMQQCGG